LACALELRLESLEGESNFPPQAIFAALKGESLARNHLGMAACFGAGKSSEEILESV